MKDNIGTSTQLETTCFGEIMSLKYSVYDCTNFFTKKICHL